MRLGFAEAQPILRAGHALKKARIVAERYAPGSSAAAVMVRHRLHRIEFFASWREFRVAVLTPSWDRDPPSDSLSETNNNPQIKFELL